MPRNTMLSGYPGSARLVEDHSPHGDQCTGTSLNLRQGRLLNRRLGLREHIFTVAGDGSDRYAPHTSA